MNLKETEKLSGFGYRERNTFFIRRSKPGGNLGMMEALKVTVYCHFDFQAFPFDEQDCDFSLFETDNNVKRVILGEVENSLHYGGNWSQYLVNGWISLPEQDGIPYKVRMKNMGTKNVYYEGHEGYSHQTVRFVLKRNSPSLLIGCFYIPTGLFAFLSIGSFIINPEIVSEYTDYNYGSFLLKII